jgi:hypothetical protein
LAGGCTAAYPGDKSAMAEVLLKCLLESPNQLLKFNFGAGPRNHAAGDHFACHRGINCNARCYINSNLVF